MLGIDADTGEIEWHFQYKPNDPYDHDGVSEHILVDTAIDGVDKQIALHADRNGFGYALDRTSGAFIWGTVFVEDLTWTSGLDPETGRPLDYDPHSQIQTYLPGTAPTRMKRHTRGRSAAFDHLNQKVPVELGLAQRQGSVTTAAIPFAAADAVGLLLHGLAHLHIRLGGGWPRYGRNQHRAQAEQSGLHDPIVDHEVRSPRGHQSIHEFLLIMHDLQRWQIRLHGRDRSSKSEQMILTQLANDGFDIFRPSRSMGVHPRR